MMGGGECLTQLNKKKGITIHLPRYNKVTEYVMKKRNVHRRMYLFRTLVYVIFALNGDGS